MECDVTLTIPYATVFSAPIILKTNGTPITFNGTLLFMVKENMTDPDSDAIISKTLTIAHTSGDPYHALINFDLTDTTKPIGKYWYGFKTGETGVWLTSNSSKAEISTVVIQGQTA